MRAAYWAGGVAGPAAFVTAWATLGGSAEGYDPTRDAISALAGRGAATRPAMTAALVALGTGMAFYSIALRSRLGGPAWIPALANGVVTLGVAALPLGSGYDTAHGVAAGLGYATLAAIPVLATPRLSARGRAGRRWAGASATVGIASGILLAASLTGWRGGLLQRLGLTLAQSWVVVSAFVLGRRRGPGVQALWDRQAALDDDSKALS